MRGSLSGQYVRRTGDTMTGALTISANVTAALIIDRPDGVGYTAMAARRAGGMNWELVAGGVEPQFLIRNSIFANLLTVRTDTGLLGAGLIPLSMLRVNEQSAANAGAVTVTAAVTTVASLPSMAVVVGQRIVVTAGLTGLKGATAGTLRGLVAKTGGDATFVSEDTLTVPSNGFHVAAGDSGFARIVSVLAITGGTTLTLSLQGVSFGSDSTVGIGSGQIRALILRE